MPNQIHESNRQHWNASAGWWAEKRERDGLWRRCPAEPELGFAGGVLELIRDYCGKMAGKDVCVIGSGDNYATFALAGMEANVTSVDISERQLDIAAERAALLGLSISFVRADASDLKPLAECKFDLVCSTNGFFVWIEDLKTVFREVFRVLKPGSHYIFYDVHPYQRPWKDQILPIEVQKPYWQTGPIKDEEKDTFEFNWTIADILNPLADEGFVLRRVLERPAGDPNFWGGSSYLPGDDEKLLNWTENPRAALPAWLSAAVQRPG